MEVFTKENTWGPENEGKMVHKFNLSVPFVKYTKDCTTK